MPDVVLRTGGDADAAEVLALWDLAAENSTRPADTAAAIHALIERDPDALLLAVYGDAIVGSLIGGWDGWRYHLYRLAVHPDYRRRGVGAALLEHTEARLSALGASRIDAMVLDHNNLGQSIWAARGYRRQTEWSRWVTTPSN